MSKKRPSFHERIGLSVASRTVLIAKLQCVLDGAGDSVPADQLDQLQQRIEGLQNRNQNPEQFLRHGMMLWETWNGKRAEASASGW